MRLLERAGVGGVMVSIVAFQAIDPGSIPGQRIIFFSFSLSFSFFPPIFFFPSLFLIFFPLLLYISFQTSFVFSLQIVNDSDTRIIKLICKFQILPLCACVLPYKSFTSPKSF